MTRLRAHGPLLAAWLIGAAGIALAQPRELGPQVRTTLEEAAQAQRNIVSRLNQILREQRLALSDGALIGILESLITDEQKAVRSIQDLGRRTLGKATSGLSGAEAADLALLTQAQESCADRYASFQRGAEHKALERPDSPFARVVLLAAEAGLADRMAASPGTLRENQLALALQEIHEILTVLEKMAAILKRELETGEAAPGTQPSLTLPSLWGKGGNYQASSFPWPGDIIDTLGAIMRAVSRLQELADQQRQVSVEVERLAELGVSAPQLPLATREWEIRFGARDVVGEVGILDPIAESRVTRAIGQIETAIPFLEEGSLPLAVEPTGLAADELAAAAKSLKDTWESILDRLAEYTLQAEGIPGTGFGVPHGASREYLEKIRRLVFALLRATRGMRIVMDRQEALLQTTVASVTPGAATMEPPALAAEQRSILGLLGAEVMPFNVLAPPYGAEKAPLKQVDFVSHLLIEDASNLLALSAVDLDAARPDEALPRQRKSLGFLEEALGEMVLALQRLLGQYAPLAMSMQDSTSAGIALRASPGAGIQAGWAWNLPPRQRTEVLQAFRGSFPERYADLIQLYFRNIAGEDLTD